LTHKPAADFEFAYLQLYSRFSHFGGLASAPELAEELGRLSQTEPEKRLAAALTDTFSLAAFPQWRHLLHETGLAAIAGAEIGISWGRDSGRTLPASLVLLAENATGYRNLCRLVSEGLMAAGADILTAYLDLETLSRYRDGLIAIAPYWGGPVTAVVRSKAAEAKNRAQGLRDIFGRENFFLAAPPPAGQPRPEEAYDPRQAGVIKLNAALVKLARENKIELIATGEARYPDSAGNTLFAALRSRLNRALAEQYPPALLQQPQDWLYYNRPDRPTADLQLYSPQELITHYNERDWPGALANNRQVAARCTGWHFTESKPLTRLRQRCEEELARRYSAGMPETRQAQNWLESELADIEELELAGPLLAASQAVATASELRQIAVIRRMSGSFVAYLLGLTERPPELLEGDPFHFGFEEGSRPLRLEVGRGGRERLLVALNNQAFTEQDWLAAPVAVQPAEPDSPALLHPRQIALSLHGAIADITPLQPAIETRHGIELRIGAQLGPVLPSGLYRLEVSEASGIARLQLALDIYNQWLLRQGKEPLEPGELPQPVEGDNIEPGTYERVLLDTRLEWFRQNHPAAWYAAALSLAKPEKRAGLAELARQNGLVILPPRLETDHPYFTIENETTIQSGLVAILGWEKAEEVRNARPFEKLNDLVSTGLLTKKEQWEALAWSGALDHLGTREAVAESAGILAETGEEWSRRHTEEAEKETSPSGSEADRGAGQLTLFDLFETMPEIAPEAPEIKLVELPEVEPLSRMQRLRQQFASLGYYTAEHPLWSLLPPDRADSSRSNIMMLSEASAKAGQEEQSQPILIAGLVAGLRRLPFTEDERGQELTVVRLEDWTGRAEMLVPPALTLPFSLEEGAALTALARWIKAEPHPVLVAEKLDVYPPSGPMVPDDDEVADFALALDNAAEIPNGGTPDGPPDDSWATSLFDGYGASSGAPPSGSTSPEAASSAPATNGKRNGGRATNRPNTPRPGSRHVHIRLNLSGEEEADNDFMNRVKALLRQHPGEDRLHIHLEWPDGEKSHLEPQSLNVQYTPEFASQVTELLGDPQGVRLEERPV
jgi:hypothetical protein